jgi:hypothetical protein
MDNFKHRDSKNFNTLKTISIMETLNDFLGKLDKVNYTITDNDKSIKGLYLGKEFEVNYRLRVHADWEGYAIQVILSLKIDEQHTQTWGCCDNEDNAVALYWFERIRNRIRRADTKFKIDSKNANELFFESM